MNRDECWRAVAGERLSLADLLDGLTDAQWETPSLCDGWRVRDVASHLTLGANPPGWLTRISWGVRRAGRFHPLNRDVAIHYAARPPAQLVAALREHAESRRVPFPVVVEHRTALADVLVHGQDIAIPLGIERPMPLDAASVAATRVWTMGWPFWARRRFRGLRFAATDTEWSAGEGTVVSGPISALLLTISGRAAALGQLDGPGATELAARMSRR